MGRVRLKPRSTVRRLVGVLLSACCLVVLALWLCDRFVSYATGDWVYTDPANVPVRPVAVLLGTSRHLPGKITNPFYKARLDMAATLYRMGKVRAIVVSGDNATRSYNEPRMMRKDLVARGVPPEAVTMDFAGFRTLDSVVRAKEVFKQDQFIIVSQRFQVERALYIARSRQIDAIGVVAESPKDFSWAWKVRLREVFARVKAVLDVHLLATMPRFLGPRVEVKGVETVPPGKTVP